MGFLDGPGDGWDLLTPEQQNTLYEAEAVMNQFPCKVCGVTDPEKPMAFRGEAWCCERHRKIIVGEFDLSQKLTKAEQGYLTEVFGR